MKIEQHTTEAPTALLRNANSVDSQETKSLCCVAAGITAPFSATAEALIPHEKLREAAHPEATLNAQDRPPAQLVVGYKRTHTGLLGDCAFDNNTVGIGESSGDQRYQNAFGFKDLHLSPIIVRENSEVPYPICHVLRVLRRVAQCYEVSRLGGGKLLQRELIQRQHHRFPFIDSTVTEVGVCIPLITVDSKTAEKHIEHLLLSNGECTHKLKHLIFFSDFCSIEMPDRQDSSTYQSQYGADCLYPVGRLLRETQYVCQHENGKDKKWREEKYLKNQERLDLNGELFGNHEWLLATIQSGSLNSSQTRVHGVAA